MPVDYSKWDALELSDDSDIEVHPNVDKRSFIRAKQNQIHQQRQQRKHHIEVLKYERQVNDGLMRRISGLLDALKSHADEARSGDAAQIAFRAVMESSAGIKPGEDNPPPRPAGVHADVEEQPTYSRMMATLLDQVNKTLEERNVQGADRYDAMVKEVEEEHLRKVETLQEDLLKKLQELEREEGSKITSESIHAGFDSSHVNKSKTSDPKMDEAKVELLNPSYAASGSADAGASSSAAGDDAEYEASPLGRQFSQIKVGELKQSFSFLSAHPEILTEREQDALLILAFEAALENEEEQAKQCVHQGLLLQYCRTLGRDGVAMFFKRVTTPGHQARDVFYKDVQDTYARIRKRSKEIRAERAAGKSQDVEQIQLHTVEPGTVINFKIPPADSEDPEEKNGREIFESFRPEVREALETGELDEVNKALGAMSVEDAEALIGQLGDAGILSLEEEIIDATTEEGQSKLKQMKQDAAATTSDEAYPDPE